MIGGISGGVGVFVISSYGIDGSEHADTNLYDPWYQPDGTCHDVVDAPYTDKGFEAKLEEEFNQ